MIAAHLAEIGEADRIAGLNLAVPVLDQTRAGFATAMMSDRAAQAAIRLSARKGYLDGRDMAEMFAWLRPTDLVWRDWGNKHGPGPQAGALRGVFWEPGTPPEAPRLPPRPVLMGARNALGHPGGCSRWGRPGRP